MKEATKARWKLLRFLEEKRISVGSNPSWRTLAMEAEIQLGLAPPEAGTPGSSPKARVVQIARLLDGKKPRTFGRKPKEITGDRCAAFYKTAEWKRLRYDALEANRQRHGVLTCECCLATDKQMHVDHIKPVRLHWNLRTEPTNLQVLCSDCNWGKGNRYETDWREPRLSVLMGEAAE